MPARYSVKSYEENGVYHIFNRGVDKRNIFVDGQDYKTFLYFLKIYLSSPEDLKKGFNPQQYTAIQMRQNFFDRIELLAYCLMPNHFHLLIKQKGIYDVTEFMRCLATNYSMYFNKNHDRTGSLFQGIFKAVSVKDDDYLLHLSRYIHLNPVELKGFNPFNLQNYDFSSYQEYLGKRNTKWIKPKFILECFQSEQEALLKDYSSYKSFVEDHALDSKVFLGKSSID